MKSDKLAGAFWCAVAVLAPVVLQGGLKIWSAAPLSLAGDHVFFLADIKQLVLGQGLWSSAATGYPFGQINAYFPTFEPLLRLVTLVFVTFGFSVFAAAKLFYVFGIASMGGAAYICFRFLSITPMLSAVGAISFAVSPYFQQRAASHDMLSIYVAAAFGAAFAVRISQMDRWDEFAIFLRRPIFIFGMIVVATCGLYYTMFSLLLMGVASLALSIRTFDLRPVLYVGGISTVVVFALIVAALGPHLAMLLSGAPRRMPVEQFWHGLSISDAMYTLDWIPWVHKHTLNYEITRPSTLVGEGYHEWPNPVLTGAILLSPLTVIVSVGRKVSDARWRAVACTAGLISFILIFAGRGGIGYLVNEMISPSLRAQARIMPLLMFLAIYATILASSWAWSVPAIWVRGCGAIFVLVLLISSWQVGGVLIQRQNSAAADPKTQALINSFKGVLAAKDVVGTRAVLQLPVTNWPEAPFKNDYDFYPMRYGFVFDRADSGTKWSYGLADRQDGFKILSASFAPNKSDPDFVQRARSLGYDAILVEKLAYDPPVLEKVVEAIGGKLPNSCKLYDDNMRVFYDVGRSEACR